MPITSHSGYREPTLKLWEPESIRHRQEKTHCLEDLYHKSMIESQRLHDKNEQDGKVIRSKKDSYKEIAATWHIQSPLVIAYPEITPLVAQCCS